MVQLQQYDTTNFSHLFSISHPLRFHFFKDHDALYFESISIWIKIME